MNRRLHALKIFKAVASNTEISIKPGENIS